MARRITATPDHMRATPFLLLAPASILFLVLIVSALMMLRLSFGLKNQEWDIWTLANYRTLIDGLYLSSFIRTLRVTIIATAAVLTLALPVALFYSRLRSKSLRRLVLFMLLLPLFLNQLLQSYGWIIVFGPTGILNNFLIGQGWIERPMRLLYSELAVIVAMSQMALPLAVLPISSALRNIPSSVEEAASVLGATRLRTLWEVTIPMAKPGLLAAGLLVFSFNISAFVIPLLLGGGRVSTVPMLIRQEMGPLLNWPQGASLALVLVLCALAIQALAWLVTRYRKSS